MRLQQKIYTFTLASGDKPHSRVLTSNVVINNKLTDLLVSQLFHEKYKQIDNTIRGYSPILENIDSKGDILINDIVYHIEFTGDKDNFILSSVADPTNYILNDKIINETEENYFETLIQSLAPTESTEQPQETKTVEETEPVGALLFDPEDYKLEKENNPEFTEYNTVPKSNMRLLVNESELPETEEDDEEKIVLIELERDEFAILLREEYLININQNEKTFTFEKIDDSTN